MGEGVGIRACFEALLPKWNAARIETKQFNASATGPIRRGVGVAGMWYGCGNTSLPNPSTVRIGLKRDGRIALHQGAIDIGQGSNTIVTQICDAITPRFEDVQYVLLHGDCHSGNILWNRDDPYFIDFDDMLYAPPVQDIWMLTGADDDYGKEQRRILLEAYEQIRTFDMTTLQLIEPLRALRMIHFSAWIARRWEDSAFKASFPDFGTEHYWQEQIEALALQLEKVQYSTTDLYR